jgi:hypothetical protein
VVTHLLTCNLCGNVNGDSRVRPYGYLQRGPTLVQGQQGTAEAAAR